MDIIQVLVFDKICVGKNVRSKKSRDEKETLYLESDITDLLGVKSDHDDFLGYAFNDINGPEGNKENISPQEENKYITEDVVMRSVMDSTRPIAQPFKRWVTGVVRCIGGGKGKYDIQEEIRELAESRKRFRDYKSEQRRLRTHCVLLER